MSNDDGGISFAQISTKDLFQMYALMIRQNNEEEDILASKHIIEGFKLKIPIYEILEDGFVLREGHGEVINLIKKNGKKYDFNEFKNEEMKRRTEMIYQILRLSKSEAKTGIIDVTEFFKQAGGNNG